jgi:cation transport protein ChaC
MAAIIELITAGAKRWPVLRPTRYYAFPVSQDRVSERRLASPAYGLGHPPIKGAWIGVSRREVPERRRNKAKPEPCSDTGDPGMNQATREKVDSLPQLPVGDLWVFGYGSLMWKPGFVHVGVRAARICGYHRALCVRSWVYRGTPEVPGLVVGLDRGGSCIGRAFRVPVADKHAVAEYLYERELATNVYLPKLVPVQLDDGRRVSTLTFVVDRAHVQYAGRLSAEEAVRGAHGRHGPNTEYISRTVEHLDELGIADSLLHEVQALLGARRT